MAKGKFTATTCVACGISFMARARVLRIGEGRYCSRHCAKYRPIESRFWTKVDTAKGPDACHPWTASVNSEGYGNVRVNDTTKKAHRVAWELTQGPIPAGMLVCHSCDNPGCCNVRHLWLGTDADNHADMMRKSRNRPSPGNRNGSRLHPGLLKRGTTHSMSKLTDDQVRAIRADTRSQTAIAIDHGINQTTVSCIKLGKTWQHVK